MDSFGKKCRKWYQKQGSRSEHLNLSEPPMQARSPEMNSVGKGMEANSILSTNMVTNWLAGRSFFDHMVLVASGDG